MLTWADCNSPQATKVLECCRKKPVATTYAPMRYLNDVFLQLGWHVSDFVASVQYNDFKGTVAADSSDTESIKRYLVECGHATDDESVIGYRIAFNGNHGKEYEPGVLIYLQKGSFDDPDKVIRAVDIEMSGPKFFSFFKRFSLVLMRDGLDLSNVTVDGPNYGD